MTRTDREHDWLAISWCLNGTRITHLTPSERRMAARRFQPRLPALRATAGPGQIPIADAAHLMGIAKSGLEKILKQLPPAEPTVCPVCRENCWRLEDGTVEAHPDRMHQQCPMSWHELPDCVEARWEALTAATVLTMARMLRDGDSETVWEWADSLGERRSKQMLVAAIAGVDPETAYEWMDELQEAL